MKNEFIEELEPIYLPKNWKPENVTRAACSIQLKVLEKDSRHEKS